MFTNLNSADLMEGYLLTFGAPAPLIPGEVAPANADAEAAESEDSDTPLSSATATSDVTADASGA